MLGLRQFTSRVLVWLAAVAVPLQFFPSASCCCAMASRPGSGAETPLGPRDCCVQAARSCCAGTRGESRPCCSKTIRASTNCRGGTTGVCSCRPHHSASPSQQARPESRGQTVDVVAQLLADVSSNLDEFKTSSSSSFAVCPTVSSGFERCIILCRFIL
jgi:hypothetical protein